MDRLEALLASRLQKPPTLFLLRIASLEDLAKAEQHYAKMVEAGELTSRDRAFITAQCAGHGGDRPDTGKRRVRNGDVTVVVTERKPAKPLALPKPLLRLAPPKPPDDPKPPPPPAKAPEDERVQQARERFHAPIRYPKIGAV